jgi:hypothetical protein
VSPEISDYPSLDTQTQYLLPRFKRGKGDDIEDVSSIYLGRVGVDAESANATPSFFQIS